MAIIIEVCDAYLTHFKDVILAGFPTLPDMRFNTDLSFDRTLRRYIVPKDVQFEVDEGTSNWIGILWNRDIIQPNETQGRRFGGVGAVKGEIILPEGKAFIYTTRFAQLAIPMVLYSPSMSTLEGVEELLFAETILLSFKFQIYGMDFNAQLLNIELGGYQFESTGEMGSITGLTMTANLSFPISLLTLIPPEQGGLPDGTRPVIMEPRIDIYTVQGKCFEETTSLIQDEKDNP